MMERSRNPPIVRGNIDRHDGSDATGSAANVSCAWSLRYLRFLRDLHRVRRSSLSRSIYVPPCSRPRHLAGERRRHARRLGADHRQLLITRPRLLIGCHALCSHCTHFFDRDDRRHQGLELVTHCPLSTRTSTRAALALV